ncbi:MAG: shikimate kinase [Pseudomonadales bacterium]
MSSVGRNVVLIGPMGAGKSAVGRALASIMGMQFIDTDLLIEERCGADIPWIFDIEGEQGFRRRETAVLKEISTVANSVIATGGGVVTVPENHLLLKQAGKVVYLSAPVDVLFRRVAKDKSRPLLQVENPRAAYKELFKQRDPIYRQLADVIYQGSENTSPQEVAKKLAERVLEI